MVLVLFLDVSPDDLKIPGALDKTSLHLGQVAISKPITVASMARTMEPTDGLSLPSSSGIVTRLNPLTCMAGKNGILLGREEKKTYVGRSPSVLISLGHPLQEEYYLKDLHFCLIK